MTVAELSSRTGFTSIVIHLTKGQVRLTVNVFSIV